jgi:hypothetical protein
MRCSTLFFRLSLAFIGLPTLLFSQEITVKTEGYQHVFEGAGVSFGLYLGHHYSMNEANQDKAIRLINEQLNMQYLQDYIDIYPADDPAYFDRRANYVKAAKVYQPDLRVSLVGNKFPADLLRDFTAPNGNTYAILNTDDPEIYQKVANWYFELFKGFYERGVEVDILNVVNEPDLSNCGANVCRRYHYGLDGDTQRAVALIFTQTVPAFKAMLNDPAINTMGMKIPLIMGPSTISPNGCLSYIRYFKTNYPEAWQQIDIVATHQYINGSREDLFAEIQAELEGKPFHQSETHASRFANQADNLGNLPVGEGLRTSLSLVSLFNTAVNHGVNAWYYFENNYPDNFHPGGLIQVAWQTDNPVPYKHYYAYQQLTSIQEPHSRVLAFETNRLDTGKPVVFRKEGEAEVVLHIPNFTGESSDIKVYLEDAAGQSVSATSMQILLTDEDSNLRDLGNFQYPTPQNRLSLSLPAYSLTTLRIGLSGTITSLADDIFTDALALYYEAGSWVLSSKHGLLIHSVNLYNSVGQTLPAQITQEGSRWRVTFPPAVQGPVIWRVATPDNLFTKRILHTQ